MGDLLGSLVQGSQKRTILCVIGVGCYSWAVVEVREERNHRFYECNNERDRYSETLYLGFYCSNPHV
jgi:hypothetical protein